VRPQHRPPGTDQIDSQHRPHHRATLLATSTLRKGPGPNRAEFCATDT
jgi:hypothetical protein